MSAITLQPQEYAAFNEWKAALKKDEQIEKDKFRSLLPLSGNLKQIMVLFNTIAMIIQDTGKASVFTKFYGHIQCVDITIYVGGWYSGKDYEFSLTAYDTSKVEDIKNVLREKLSELNILDQNQLETILNQ